MAAAHVPVAGYAAAGAEPLTRRQLVSIGRIREELRMLDEVKELERHLLAEVRALLLVCTAVSVST